MFVIACKYVPENNFIIKLVESIRKFHPNDKICVVDSDSDDKTYALLLQKHDVIFMDARNKHHMIGAYWHAYESFPDEDFYFFMHDSMLVKANLDYLKTRELVTMCFFDRNQGNFNFWSNKVESTLNIPYKNEGLGCYGPIFFCKNSVMKSLDKLNVGSILPNNKQETGYCEGMYGFLFEYIGFDLAKCALFGDVLANESRGGKSGIYPHTTQWQHPVEKFYGSHLGGDRSWPEPTGNNFLESLKSRLMKKFK